jgi:CO dehydrogenase maturation factor
VRIAVAGKGGAGKTTIAATLARLLARRGRPVVAIDADSNPNLGVALGVPPSAEPPLLPGTLVSRRLDGAALTMPFDAVVAEHGVSAPDGIGLLHMGMPKHADEGCLCSAHATVSALLDDLGRSEGTVTVVDLEASPEHLSRGTARHVDVLLLVAEPYYRSLETVRRMAVLAAELAIPRVVVVANKVRLPEDAAAIAEFCDRHGLTLAGEVPWQDGVLDADGQGIPVIDHGAARPVVDAVRDLAGALLGEPAPTP